MKTIVACPSCQQLSRVDIQKAQTLTPKCGKCKIELKLHKAVQEATLLTLNTLIGQASMPVVVDFWAPWCGPCRSFAPTFEQASLEFGDKFIFAKVNTEQYPEAAAPHDIRGIPTLVVFRNGTELTRQSGAMPLPMFKNFLQQL